MKKNLRIVSAAAAALLAVAPVAATSVSTAFAAELPTTITPGNGTSNADVTDLQLKVSASNIGSIVATDSVTKLTPVISSAVGTPQLNGKTQVYLASDIVPPANKGDNSTVKEGAKPVDKFDKDVNVKYVIFSNDVSISGLTKNGKYTINGGTKTADTYGNITGINLVSTEFTVADTTKDGAPYVRDNKGKIAASGSVSLDTVKTVNDLVDRINAEYTAASTVSGDNGASASFPTLEQDVRDALKTAGVTVRTDGTFDKPAAPFTINVKVATNNGKSTTFAITANPSSTVGGPTFPQISWAGLTTPVSGNQTIDSIDSITGGEAVNYVPVNGAVNENAIKALFTAQVSATDKTNLAVTVDASKVNTKVAGKYPVTVSATNADKKTSKVTFYITVGAKGATYKTVQSDGDVPVYEINGNTVTDTKTTVKNGDQIAIFGEPVKIGDKTYARINSADSNKFVESKYVDGSFKPAEKTSKTVMHNAYIYDKDHKRVGTKTLAAYTKVDVLGATTKLADGSLVYQIGDNQYVMADNIDGTVRTLSHNAYVYKTSKKRADSRVLRKGAKVTTYGSPYTFKNGKAYYRIGGPSKQYVKVANFN
ncbi:cell surface protein [Lactobacillus panisapium]|uniref:SLAP domain-containing protein n=1 Tax=Lactobacillus panisapium TaxID=2012495 RepID=UPI001C6A4FD6|nr:SLAP domain-containing protein [Lactobacillus panisapium]QYN59331.1 cell surface protein [Lactobacillus panisapium]